MTSWRASELADMVARIKPETRTIPRNVKTFGPQSDRSRLVPKMPIEAWDLKAAAPPPGVVPKGREMAMDSMSIPANISGWAANSFYNLAFIEGWTFLGYPYLSQLAQIPEYRLPSETIAAEATRKWIDIISSSDREDLKNGGEGNAKSDKIAELDDEMNRLGVREAFKLIAEQDGFFGRAHLYIDTGATDKREELMTPIGDGGEFTEKKFKKGFLRCLKTVEPVWCYPARYEAADPLKDNWYRPDTWFVNGKEVHASRLLPFIARPVPDLLKPTFSFGGLSLSQMMKPYVDNWLETRQSVNDIVQNFSFMVLLTDLSALLQTGGDELEKRIAIFNQIRNNRGVFVANKDMEDLKNVAAPLGSLDKLQAQAQEHMASPAQIPLVKLFGIQPTGLNASSDGEIRVFYDRMHAYQESFMARHLRTIFRLAQINIWGKVDADLDFEFKPLYELNEKELAEKDAKEAESDQKLVDAGILDAGEVRRRKKVAPGSPYSFIDADDVPEPILPEPKNIREIEKAPGEE